ncbi:MAG TPA: hypothetical protein VKO18_17440 [Terriglobia bacterium]|nr:hypothetical protein [Terriglobia bacterium]
MFAMINQVAARSEGRKLTIMKTAADVLAMAVLGAALFFLVALAIVGAVVLFFALAPYANS